MNESACQVYIHLEWWLVWIKAAHPVTLCSCCKIEVLLTYKSTLHEKLLKPLASLVNCMKTNFYLCPASVDEIPWSLAIQMKATVQCFSFSFLFFFFFNAVQSSSNFWVWKWNLRVFLKSVILHIFPTHFFSWNWVKTLGVNLVSVWGKILLFINRRWGLHGEKKVNFSILLQVSGWNIIPATNDSYIGAR